MRFFNDETELVEHAFEQICEREFGKGLDEQLFPVEKQKQLFSILAVDSTKLGNKFTKDTLIGWAQDFIPSDLADDLKHEQLDCVGRHAILTTAGGAIEFAHDILKQYLIADFLLEELTNTMLSEFDHEELESGSFSYKYLSARAVDCNWSEILQRLNSFKLSPQSESRGFRNVLKIFLSAGQEKKEDRLLGLVSNTNLTGLTFQGLNLQQFNFHNSKLHSVRFVGCNLTKAEFDGCDFKDTSFEKCILTGASTKEAAMESIEADGKRFYDQKEIQGFFFERTQVPLKDLHSPCQAAINLRKVFEKLTRRGRGFKIPLNFVSNTKVGGGVPAAKITATILKEGYVTQEANRIKVKINLYDEVSEFVHNFRSTAGIRTILDLLCTDIKIGCQHVN